MAQHYHQRALAMREELVGVDNFDTAESLCNVSRVYAARGNYTDAACLLDRAIVICENTRGATNHETALKYDAFGELLLAQGDHARAQHYFSRALAIYTGSYPPEHQAIRRVRVHLQTAAGMD